MIEFQNVSYSYKKGSGVNNVNVRIDDGEFAFLIGPTGSGKTTLMRLIYFDLFPDAGSIRVGDFTSVGIKKRIYPKREKILVWCFRIINF